MRRLKLTLSREVAGVMDGFDGDCMCLKTYRAEMACEGGQPSRANDVLATPAETGVSPTAAAVKQT